MLNEDDDFVEDEEGTADEVTARKFFGFSPLEAIDALTLRSRKFKKDSAARSQRDRDLSQHYFDVLARLVGISTGSTTPEPPREQSAPPPTREAKPAREEPTPARSSRAAKAPIDDDPEGSSSAARSTLDRVRHLLDYALNEDVIEHTIVAYDRLFQAMVSLARALGVTSNGITNAWVRSHIQTPAPEKWSREHLEEIEEMFVKGLHISLGGTPEYNHPQHRYIANAPESRLGLQFEEIINAIREKAEELLGR
jgi:hypothetical protein